MKKPFFASALLSFSLLTPSLKANEFGPEIKALVEGSQEFTFALYQKLVSQEKGNLFFSPSSIHTAFGMVYAGAAGTTSDQMAKAMVYPAPGDKLAGQYGELIKLLNTPRLTKQNKPAYELVVSNALWPAKGFTFLPSYSELIKKHYQATSQELDYSQDPEGSRKTINSAVAKQTADKIQDLLSKDMINTNTRLVLTNAIYFKSDWAKPFDKKVTRTVPFQVDGAKTVNCQMMKQSTRHGYYENAELQLLEIPYVMKDLTMIILLPKDKDGVKALEQKVNARQLREWLAQVKDESVDLSLPRFKTTSQFKLPEMLKALGMVDAFSGAANFSAMAHERLHISDAIHKAFVSVDEDGTEAAAATGISMEKSKPKDPKIFLADHPFLYLIRHVSTDTLLFAGRLVNPE